MSTASMEEACRCGLLAARRTSWSELNPGRRFTCCPQSQGSGGCGYFSWIDPPSCGRCNRIIPGLLRNLNSKDEELEVLKKKEALLKKRNVQLWIVILAFLVVVYCILAV